MHLTFIIQSLPMFSAHFWPTIPHCHCNNLLMLHLSILPAYHPRLTQLTSTYLWSWSSSANRSQKASWTPQTWPSVPPTSSLLCICFFQNLSLQLELSLPESRALSYSPLCSRAYDRHSIPESMQE